MVGSNFYEQASTYFNIYAPKHSDLDLLDYQSVLEFFKQQPIDIIIHAAGVVGGIHANINDPVLFLTDNLRMGQNVIMAARESAISRLINLGSSCMYPHAWKRLLKEEDIFSGDLEQTNEGYAIAKSALSRLCTYISKEETSLQYKTVIPCNLYGRYDSFQLEKSHLVAGAMHKLHLAKEKNQKEVIIWGDGTVRREVLYSGDLADCLLYAVRNFETMPVTVNVGWQIDYTIREYYEIIAEVVGYKGAFTYDKSKPNGVKRKLMDVQKMKDWGWCPRTSLKEGVQKMYSFYLKHHC